MLRRYLIVISFCIFGLFGLFRLSTFENTNGQNKVSSEIVQNTPLQTKSESLVKENLSDTIINICKFIERKNIDELEELVTEVPEIYVEKSRDLMRKSIGMDDKTYQESIRNQKGKYTVSAYPISANKEELVYNVIPSINTIQEQKIKLLKVVSLNQHENEGKAVVVFGNGKVPDSKYEILLIRDEDGWKAFSFTFPSKWSATYAEEAK